MTFAYRQIENRGVMKIKQNPLLIGAYVNTKMVLGVYRISINNLKSTPFFNECKHLVTLPSDVKSLRIVCNMPLISDKYKIYDRHKSTGLDLK